MADSQARFEPLDPGRIDTQSHEELRYWSRELHCTEPHLLDVIGQVGNHVAGVREYLESERRARPRR